MPGWEEGLSSSKINRRKRINGLEEDWLMLVLLEQKNASISFSMNRFYQGDWIDSMASRFIDELPEKFLEKNSFLMKVKMKLMTSNLIKILKQMKITEALVG